MCEMMKIVPYVLVAVLLCGCRQEQTASESPSTYEMPKGTNIVETFYTNGQPYEYGVYVDGLPVGVHKMWDQRGNLVSSGIHSNGSRWYGTFYMMGAGDWYQTYTNGVELEDMPIPDGLSDYHIMLYQRNWSYEHKKSFRSETINGYAWRGLCCTEFDWSDFPGFLNYREDEVAHNKTIDSDEE